MRCTMNKCDCYFKYEKLQRDPIWSDGTFTKVFEGRCYGTKEMERCSCGGDPAKCDFYPEKRVPAKKKEESNDSTTIYYAHHQWKYGTKVEQYELDLIKRYFPHAKIFNPSVDLKIKTTNEEYIMEECLAKVNESDIVIFSSMDGCIGTGVYHEIEEAKKIGKLILYIFNDTLLTSFDIFDRPYSIRTDRLYATVATSSPF